MSRRIPYHYDRNNRTIAKCLQVILFHFFVVHQMIKSGRTGARVPRIYDIEAEYTNISYNDSYYQSVCFKSTWFSYNSTLTSRIS